MPIIKAAVKALRQSEKHRKVNRVMKDHLKEALKDILKLAQDKKIDEAKKMLSSVTSLIDKAVKNHLLPKNTASRKKSRLARLLATK